MNGILSNAPPLPPRGVSTAHGQSHKVTSVGIGDVSHAAAEVWALPPRGRSSSISSEQTNDAPPLYPRNRGNGGHGSTSAYSPTVGARVAARHGQARHKVLNVIDTSDETTVDSDVDTDVADMSTFNTINTINTNTITGSINTNTTMAAATTNVGVPVIPPRARGTWSNRRVMKPR